MSRWAVMGLVLAIVASLTACPQAQKKGEDSMSASGPTGTAGKMSGVPVIDKQDEILDHDEQVIRLVGTYKAHPLEVKMGRPPRHMGHVAIWVGQWPIMVGTQPRPDAERKQFEGLKVSVVGKLVMNPRSAQHADVATADPPPYIDPQGTIEAQ